jgi:hypothetical protein
MAFDAEGLGRVEPRPEEDPAATPRRRIDALAAEQDRRSRRA